MNENECYCDELEELNIEILDMISRYEDMLPPYEIGNSLINEGVAKLLMNAPNHYLAMRMILGSVENAIKEYQKFEKHCE